MGIRKRETERIERENHAFAKRLFDKQAVLQKKTFDKDWQSHLTYKRQIAKMQHPLMRSQQGGFSRGRQGTAGALSQQHLGASPESAGVYGAEGLATNTGEYNMMQQPDQTSGDQ